MSNYSAPLFRDVLGSVANHVGSPLPISAAEKTTVQVLKRNDDNSAVEHIHYTQAAQVAAPGHQASRVLMALVQLGLGQAFFKGLYHASVSDFKKGHKFHFSVHGVGIVFHSNCQGWKGSCRRRHDSVGDLSQP